MLKVLFVCTGNICRSPLAEGVFQNMVNKKGLAKQIQCDSAATHAYHIGALADRRARQTAQRHGIALTHRARKLSGDDFAEFDYLVAMDEGHFGIMQNLSYRSTGFDCNDNLVLYRYFEPQTDNAEPESKSVPDPYYDDMAAFENVFEIVARCGKQFLDFLVEKHKLHL